MESLETAPKRVDVRLTPPPPEDDLSDMRFKIVSEEEALKQADEMLRDDFRPTAEHPPTPTPAEQPKGKMIGPVFHSDSMLYADIHDFKRDPSEYTNTQLARGRIAGLSGPALNAYVQSAIKYIHSQCVDSDSEDDDTAVTPTESTVMVFGTDGECKKMTEDEFSTIRELNHMKHAELLKLCRDNDVSLPDGYVKKDTLIAILKEAEIQP